MIWKNKLKEKLPLPRIFGMNKALVKLAKPHLRVLLTIAASVAPLNFTKADTLTAEEQALVDKGAVMEMYKPDEHSRHFIAHLFLGSKTQNRRKKKDEVWPSVTIAHPKPTNSFLHKDGTSITTDFLPGVMFRRVKPRMTKQ